MKRLALAVLAIITITLSARAGGFMLVTSGGGGTNDILMESGSYVLQEDGASKLILEP